MGRFDRAERLKMRVQELETAEGRLATRMRDLEDAHQRLDSHARLLATEWAEMLQRLTKAFQRVERANQRAVRRDDPTPEPVRPAVVPSDAFSRKVQLIREQRGDAVLPGNGTPSG